MERLLYAIMKKSRITGDRASEVTETCEGIFVTAYLHQEIHFCVKCDNVIQAKRIAKGFVNY